MARTLGVPHIETIDAMGSGRILRRSSMASPDFKDADLKPDDLAAILYTSGTTGKPKGAMMSQQNLATNAQALSRAWHFSSSDVLLHALPIYHTHGLFVAINVALISGASVMLQPSFNVDAVLDALPRASVMMGVPTFYTRLLQSPRLTRDIAANMRLFISGSAPLQATTHAEFEAATGHVILERYGMTETGINTSNSYEGERVPGCVGTALPGVEIRIAESGTGTELKGGDVGIIEIRGPNVFKGYWRQPEKTSPELRPDGFFISGDLAYKDRLGRIHIVGREKDLIISGGFNVYPAEVEAAIEQIPDVAQCAVIGVPHPDYGEGTVAVIVPRQQRSVSKETVRNHLVNELAKYKLPKEIVLVDGLPLNSMGKVQKNVLRNLYKTVFRQ